LFGAEARILRDRDMSLFQRPGEDAIHPVLPAFGASWRAKRHVAGLRNLSFPHVEGH
jgi:hypothetical protein